MGVREDPRYSSCAEGLTEMAFRLDDVVPWGRSFNEYCRMFQLTAVDLTRRVVGCADGPAAFNAQATQFGGSVISCDPLYALTADSIRRRIDECFATVLDQARQNIESFVWSADIPDIESLAKIRCKAMQEFLIDFPEGKRSGRYVDAALPSLPFPDDHFDLAICSHFLFLYDALGQTFHEQALDELTRVASEVRIFPLVQLDGRKSPWVEPLVDRLGVRQMNAEVVRVSYEFQRGANQMLRVSNSRDAM